MAKRTGFTLVELVVVVMILGILAAVAAPKLLGTSGAATDAGLKQTLSVVRDAIERYEAETGQKPDDPATDLIPNYLRAPFPSCPVGAPDEPDGVLPGESPLAGTADADEGWAYDSTSGEFIINHNGTDSKGTPYDSY
jgi:general secretion pathway protein G